MRGHVTEVHPAYFVAVVEDLLLEVEKRHLSAEDRAWLEEVGVGCILELVIEETGDKQHARFEFPKERWTQAEIDAAVRASEELYAFFNEPPTVLVDAELPNELRVGNANE
jgi:hypothetical protein